MPRTETASATQRARGLQEKPGTLRRLLGEPLVHFFAVGALVFGAYWSSYDGAGGGGGRASRSRSVQTIFGRCVVAWLAQGRSPLTRDQLQSLIDQKVSEEVLFREGHGSRSRPQRRDHQAQGGAEDGFSGRRCGCLAGAGTGRSWRRGIPTHADRFAVPPRMSFRQLYFSPDKRGTTAREDAAAALGASPTRPPTPPKSPRSPTPPSCATTTATRRPN